MAYATGLDLVARYDVDLIGDLASDDRETLARNDVPVHPHVQAALDDASGEVDAALLAGGRYTAEQLSSLTGSSKSYLKAIVCGLAMAALHDRRPEAVHSETIERLTKKSRDAIYSLRRGENVFGIADHIEATQLHISGPSAIQLQNRNGLPERMSRYFPSPASRLPRGQ
jgi:phage gp36-like protein